MLYNDTFFFAGRRGSINSTWVPIQNLHGMIHRFMTFVTGFCFVVVNKRGLNEWLESRTCRCTFGPPHHTFCTIVPYESGHVPTPSASCELCFQHRNSLASRSCLETSFQLFSRCHRGHASNAKGSVLGGAAVCACKQGASHSRLRLNAVRASAEARLHQCFPQWWSTPARALDHEEHVQTWQPTVVTSLLSVSRGWVHFLESHLHISKSPWQSNRVLMEELWITYTHYINIIHIIYHTQFMQAGFVYGFVPFQCQVISSDPRHVLTAADMTARSPHIDRAFPRSPGQRCEPISARFIIDFICKRCATAVSDSNPTTCTYDANCIELCVCVLCWHVTCAIRGYTLIPITITILRL